VDGSLAERVVDSVLEDEDVTEADLARRVVEGWLGRQGTRTVRSLASEERSPESEKARRRLYGYLARRGFRGQALGRAMALAKELARA
jgi:SOS response regulatory protein OraA/RecX